jgi:lipopolysaccharide assembly outer membrane protein LptD (OstA)
MRSVCLTALALLAGLARVPVVMAQPPLNISAANVTGSRGPEGDIVLLNGDVRITRGLTVITADRGRYLRSQGMLYLDDRVRMVDTTTTMSCQHAAFSEEKDLLQVSGDVVITDRGTTLRAPTAPTIAGGAAPTSMAASWPRTARRSSTASRSPTGATRWW